MLIALESRVVEVAKWRFTFSNPAHPEDGMWVKSIFGQCSKILDSGAVLWQDGRSPMRADINMNGHDIVNPGLVDGVDVSSHAARHQPGGVDEVRPGKYANTVIFSSSSTTPTAWSTLSTGVGTRAFVVLRIYNTSGANRTFYLMPGDDSVHPQSDVNYSAALSSVRVNNANMAYTAMITDTSGRIKWYCDQAVTGIEVKLMGYIKLI